jgi:fatty-acyl-CoA synthase
MTPSDPTNIAEMLRRSAERWPGQIALIDGETVVTDSALWQHVQAAAAGLQTLGLRQGDHIGFFLAESWRHVVALYGALHAGAVVVPLNLAWKGAELAHALDAADVTFLVIGATHRDRDLLAPLREAHVESTGTQNGDHFPQLRYVLPDWGESPRLAEIVSASGRGCSSADSDDAFLMFTSGSTARPKAALITHAAPLSVARSVSNRLSLTPGDHILNTSPLYHCAGLIVVLLSGHLSGATIALFEGYQHTPMLEHLWTQRANVLIGFDVVTTRLIRSCMDEYGSVPVTKMLSGPGRPIYDEMEALGIDLAIMYGLTEASNIVTLTSRLDHRDGRRNSNGTALEGVEVRICDPTSLREVGVGQTGEIAFRGWNLMKGYYRNGVTTLDLDEDGFFHTGDYGFQDPGGRIYYRGRYAGMIKTGGENVSQAEVELFLGAEFPWIRHVAVVGLPDETWGEMVVAIVDCDADDVAAIESLREQCRGRIAGFKVPKVFMHIPVAEWPISAIGKVDKAQLAGAAADRCARVKS